MRLLYITLDIFLNIKQICHLNMLFEFNSQFIVKEQTFNQYKMIVTCRISRFRYARSLERVEDVTVCIDNCLKIFTYLQGT